MAVCGQQPVALEVVLEDGDVLLHQDAITAIKDLLDCYPPLLSKLLDGRSFAEGTSCFNAISGLPFLWFMHSSYSHHLVSPHSDLLSCA